MSLPQTPPSENPKESLGDPEGQSLHIENSAEIRRQHGDDGTVVMFQHVGVGSELGDRLLIPRPTDDPNDPLTWPLWQKYSQLAGLCCFGFFGTCYISGISTGFGQIAVALNVTDDSQFSYLIAFPILSLGAAGFVWMPLAFKWGRRPVYIISSLMCLACAIWSATAKSYGSLLASRIIGAFGASSVESIGNVSISELIFLHERGSWIAFLTLWIFLGTTIGPICTGYIIDASGWRAGIWFHVGIAGLVVLFVVFTLQETVFPRSESGKIGLPDLPDYQRPFPLRTKKTPYLATLAPFHKEAYSPKSLLWMFAVPWLMGAFPIVWLCSLYYGVVSGVNLGITVALGKMMILPPYNFNSGAVGLSNIAPLVGTLVAVLAGGVIADWFSMWRTRRNRGIREPEMRLPLVWLSSVIGFAGSLLYGFAIDRELPWISEVVGFGMTSFSIALTSSLILTYAVDSYYTWALPCLCFLQGFKNVVSCVLIMEGANWWNAQGVKGAFSTLGGVLMVATLPLTAVMIWGGKMRQWQKNQRAFKLLSKSSGWE